MKANQPFKQLLLIFLVALPFWANTQTENKITIGHFEIIQSKILNEERFLWIYTPDEDGDSSFFAKQRYPVVYLLDGNYHFHSVVAILKHLSITGLCPKMIVVGIPNTDRDRDLTPTHDSTNSTFTTSGGGEHFMSFIEKELMPFIDAKYPTESYKMLIGHSLGGLTVMNTLIHHSDLFNAYIAIDASMWWDNRKLLKEAKKVLGEKQFEGKSLFLSIANTMNEGMDINKVQTDTTSSTNHIRALLDLKSYLETHKQNGLKSQCKYYDADDHGSVTLITEYDALRFLFDDYPFKIMPNDYNDTTAAFIDKYEKHYAKVSKRMGYKVKPPESQLNILAFDALHYYQNKKLERLLQLYINYYPESFVAHDIYGDFLSRMGEKDSAALHYNKALSIHEFEGTKQKLEDLQTLKLTVEQLQRYTGEFVVAESSMTIKIFVNKNVLTVSVAGEPDLELYSTKTNEFKVKNIKNYILRFEMDEERAIRIIVDSPTGKVKATLKK